MPRSNSGRHEGHQTAVWAQLAWWNRFKVKGDRDYPYNVQMSPVPMIAELERRDDLCCLSAEEREKAFYKEEVEGHVWAPEFDNLWENFFKKKPHRKSELIKNFMSPFRNFKPMEVIDSLECDEEGYSARGAFLVYVTAGIGCAEKLCRFTPAPEAKRFKMLFRRYLMRCFPDDTSQGSRFGMLGGYYGGRTVYWAPEYVMLFRPFSESKVYQAYVSLEGVACHNWTFRFGSGVGRKGGGSDFASDSDGSESSSASAQTEPTAEQLRRKKLLMPG